MSYPFDSRLGEQLYRLMPEVYRTRDRQGDTGDSATGDQHLARYLDAHGHLLDLLHATFEQQLKDALPGTSQQWLLPYFARLLATNIVSPDLEGKQAEVANTVSWRQRKGTLKCVEEIAQVVGQMEVEIQEGWQRVAMTPRVGTPLVPAAAIDNTIDIDMGQALASEVIRHPSLPAVMVDLRRPSRAVEAEITNPAAKSSNFGGIRQTWRQSNRHGAPCFPDSFEDVSRRTADIRTPADSAGLYEHKRLLVFAPPPTGFFGLEPLKITWDERTDSLHEHLFEELSNNGRVVIRNRTARVIEISDDVALATGSYRIEGINFQGELKVAAGGTLELARVEAGKVSVATFSTDKPVLTACDCLFGELSSAGHVQLDSCTVLEEAYLSSMSVRDCIFMDIQGTEITGVIEYSRIADTTSLSTDVTKMSIKSHILNSANKFGYDPVTDLPGFIPGQTALAARAVLSPNAPKSIYEGASDHGEMGYYHRGRKNRPVRITGNPAFSLLAAGGYPLADIAFNDDITVSSGQLSLIRSAAPGLTVATPLNNNGAAIPSLTATDCLFQRINVAQGLARLEYCTVMETANCKHLQASDCIFSGTISGVEELAEDSAVDHFTNCLRYSAVNLIDKECLVIARTNTTAQPVFSEFHFCSGTEPPRKAVYGEWGYGVLGPLTPPAVRFGAEDGGEMGAYHHRYYSLKVEAMLKKMQEFLPIGIEPTLLQDERLLHVPPEIKKVMPI